jgi:RimJ/RimL family protein N-acetyltransferase
MKNSRFIFLKGYKTILRLISKEDASNVVRWLNDPEVRRFLLRQNPLTIEAEYKWIEENNDRPNDIVLAMETLQGIHIGNIGLHRIDWVNRNATTGTVIGEKKFQGKGYGTDAKMLLLDYAFNTLNLHKVCSGAIAFNQRSINYSKVCGYVIEARRIQQLFRDGAYQDEVLLAVFSEGFKKAQAKYIQKMKKMKRS